MPATAVLLQLLQLLCCCSNFDGDSNKITPKAKKAVLLATSDKEAGNPETSKEQAVKPEASKKQAAKGHVCAPCNHQDAINQIKGRYVIGSITPHWATTVAGGKDLSV